MIDAFSRPALARGIRLASDKVTGQPVLLFPEGVVHLSPTAHAILTRCNAETSVEMIVASLCEEYEANEADLMKDVLDCLKQLQQRKLVVVS